LYVSSAWMWGRRENCGWKEKIASWITNPWLILMADLIEFHSLLARRSSPTQCHSQLNWNILRRCCESL
jgi:hypothetical protein